LRVTPVRPAEPARAERIRQDLDPERPSAKKEAPRAVIIICLSAPCDVLILFFFVVGVKGNMKNKLSGRS
jgi:hypothetical protein